MLLIDKITKLTMLIERKLILIEFEFFYDLFINRKKSSECIFSKKNISLENIYFKKQIFKFNNVSF